MPIPYRSAFDGPIIRRVRVTPERPEDFPQRAPRTRRPHGEAQVAAVRHLIEQTELTYAEIEKRTGVDLDKLAAALELAKMAKLAALGRKRRRTLAREQREALHEPSPPFAPVKTGAQESQAPAQAALGSRLRGNERGESPSDTASILARLRAEGVRLDRAPEAAVKDFIDSHRPPEDDRALRPRGTKSRRVQAHRRMFDWGRD
jgi:hypothetical protein